MIIRVSTEQIERSGSAGLSRQATYPEPNANAVRALRGSSFAMVVLLLIEYGLGMWVNLYGQLPASDHGASLATGFARAITDGPVGLSIHAVLGVVLIVSTISALVRSIAVRRPALIAATAVGLAAVVVAASSGARFVGSGDNAASMSMALAAGVAIGAYVLVLFLLPSAVRRPDAGPAPK